MKNLTQKELTNLVGLVANRLDYAIGVQSQKAAELQILLDKLVEMLAAVSRDNYIK